jgi:superfamily II DNA or RNA helicase
MTEIPSLSPDELKTRLADLEKVAGSRFAPLGDRDALVRIDQDELNIAYPARWYVYVKALKELRVSAKSRNTREATNRGDAQKEAQMTRLLRRLTMLNNYEQHMAEIRDNKGATPLRANQMPMYEAFGGFLEKKMGEENPRGYCVLPTGSGKTVIFSQLLYTFLTHHEKNERQPSGDSNNSTDTKNPEMGESEADRPKALIVVPTAVLVGQTRVSINTFFPGLRVGEFHSLKRDDPEDVDIMVTTYASAVNRAKSGQILDPNQFDIVILDEAHRGLTDRRKETVDRFTQSVILGFTATPDFSDDKQTKGLLHQEIMNVRLTEAHDMGLICPFKVAVADTQIDISSVDIDNGNYDEAQLERLINTPARNQAVVELHHQLGTTNKFIGFCSTRAHCDAVADAFASPTKGQDKLNVFSWTDIGTIKSGLVNSESKALEGEELKTELARRLRLPHNDPNAIHGIVSVQKALEGFDEPILTHCYNITPTCSRINATQRAGRVMRLLSETDQMILGGPKTAYVVDFRDQDRRNEQVLFTDILMGDIRKSKPNNSEGKPSITEDEVKEILSRYIATSQGVAVDGLKFNISLQEVYDITRREKQESNQNAERLPEIAWKLREAELLQTCPLPRQNHIPRVDIQRAVTWKKAQASNAIPELPAYTVSGGYAKDPTLAAIIGEYWADVAKKFDVDAEARSLRDIAQYYGIPDEVVAPAIKYAHDAYIRAGKLPIIEYTVTEQSIHKALWELVKQNFSAGAPTDPSRQNKAEVIEWKESIDEQIDSDRDYVEATCFFRAIGKSLPDQDQLILKYVAIHGIPKVWIDDAMMDQAPSTSHKYLTPDAARYILTLRQQPPGDVTPFDSFCENLGLVKQLTRDYLLDHPKAKDMLILSLPANSSGLEWYLTDAAKKEVLEQFKRDIERAANVKKDRERRTTSPGWVEAKWLGDQLDASLVKMNINYQTLNWIQTDVFSYFKAKGREEDLRRRFDASGGVHGTPHFSPSFCGRILLLMSYIRSEIGKENDPRTKMKKANELFTTNIDQLYASTLEFVSKDNRLISNPSTSGQTDQSTNETQLVATMEQKMLKLHEWNITLLQWADEFRSTHKELLKIKNANAMIDALFTPLYFGVLCKNTEKKQPSTDDWIQNIWFDGTPICFPTSNKIDAMKQGYNKFVLEKIRPTPKVSP